MSLMGTLAKVAVGVAVAKGAKAMMQGSGNARGRNGSNGLFGGQYSPQSGQGATDMISQLLGGNAGNARGQGGLGGILETLAGGQGGARSSGGLNNLVNGFANQLGGQAGGLAGMIGGLAAAAGAKGAAGNQGFGALFNQALAKQGEPDAAPSADQEAMAGLMLAAMIQAAKSDGEIDKEETDRFLKDLGDIDQQELAFIQECMKAPIDIEGLVRQTPRGLEAQLYTVSVLAITLDEQSEAQYLHALASGLGLQQAQVNDIHDQLGVPRIYS